MKVEGNTFMTLKYQNLSSIKFKNMIYWND